MNAARFLLAFIKGACETEQAFAGKMQA